MRNLGLLYDNAQGVEQDYAKAREWYEKAAAKHDLVAMNNLGLLYMYGRGVDKDESKAHQFFEMAKARNNDAILPKVRELRMAPRH